MDPISLRGLSAGLAALAAVGFAAVANAATVNVGAVTLDESLSALPANASIQVLDAGVAGATGLVTSGELWFGAGNTIQFGPKTSSQQGGLYDGTKTGVAAAPYVWGGPQTTNYFAAEPGSAVTISYTQDQHYFGINWGSVDAYNTLSFYEGAVLVAQYTGSDITSTPHGSQGADNSYIANFNFSDGASYNKVVMTDTTHPAFEFDTIAFSTQAIPISSTGGAPTPVAVYTDAAETQKLAGEAPLPMLGASPLGALALAGAAFLHFRRRAATRAA